MRPSLSTTPGSTHRIQPMAPALEFKLPDSGSLARAVRAGPSGTVPAGPPPVAPPVAPPWSPDPSPPGPPAYPVPRIARIPSDTSGTVTMLVGFIAGVAALAILAAAVFLGNRRRHARRAVLRKRPPPPDMEKRDEALRVKYGASDQERINALFTRPFMKAQDSLQGQGSAADLETSPLGERGERFSIPRRQRPAVWWYLNHENEQTGVYPAAPQWRRIWRPHFRFVISCPLPPSIPPSHLLSHPLFPHPYFLLTIEIPRN